MKIAGLQKMTLIDYPGKVACTIFLHGCGFRCGFCYNPELVIKPIQGGFTQEQVLAFLEQRKGKLDAVCITGGEPLMTLDFSFLQKIKEKGYLIKLDTNGNYPQRLQQAITQGLVDYIAMDIKAGPEKYSTVVGVNLDLRRIESSMKIIHDFGNYEFRTTVLYRYHDALEMDVLGRWVNSVVEGKPRVLYLQGFKAGYPTLNKAFHHDKNVSEEDLQKLKGVIQEYFGEVYLRV